MRGQRPPVRHPGQRRESRPATPIWPPSTAWSSATIRAKAWCAAATSCIPGSASPSWHPRLHARQHRAGHPGRQARRRPGAAARRGARADRAVAHRLSQLRLDRERRSDNSSRTSPSTALPARPRRQRRSMVVPAVRGAVRQRRLPLHLRHQAHDARDRPVVPRVGRHLPAHEHRRDQGGAAAAAAGSHRRHGDTVEQLASRMAVVDRKLERFRILNGLEPGDRLQPRQRSQNRG